MLRLVSLYGLERGVRQRIADELGVHRSTISRDSRPPSTCPAGHYRLLPRHRPRNVFACWSRSALDSRPGGCDCEDKTEPRHRLGHVLRFVAEALDLVEEGTFEMATPEDVASLKSTRDLLVKVCS